MYDFWFSLGIAIMRPTLLEAIDHAGPKFTLVKREIKETVIATGVAKSLPVAPSTGLLLEDSTNKVRLAIAKFVHHFPGAPPVGIACAGRFCQVMSVKAFDTTKPDSSTFRHIAKIANAGYRNALIGPESCLPSFPAFLGACLMDARLAYLVKQSGTPILELAQVLGEFGIKADAGDPNLQFAVRFVKTTEFAGAYDMLMNSNNDPWKGVCSEQIYWWRDKSEHAIP